MWSVTNSNGSSVYIVFNRSPDAINTDIMYAMGFEMQQNFPAAAVTMTITPGANQAQHFAPLTLNPVYSIGQLQLRYRGFGRRPT